MSHFINSTLMKYLSSDQELVNMLNHSPKNGRLKILTMSTKNIVDNQIDKSAPYIIFEIVPFQIVHEITEYRIKISIIASTENEIDAISNKIIKLLHTKNKAGFMIDNTTIFHSKMMQGGSLFYHEEQSLYEQIKYFHIKVN